MEEISSLNPNIAYALLKANLRTVHDVIKVNTKELRDVNISSENVNLIKQIAVKEKLKNKIFTVDQIMTWARISTGCSNIDKVLKGGIPVQGIVELYGPSGVGKTQFCLQIALQIQLPLNVNGKEKEAVFICTEDVFPTKRLNQLANIWNIKHNMNIHFQDHIYIEHIAEAGQMINCLTNTLPKLMAHKNIGIIIIDSIAGLFRSENENPNYIVRSKYFREISKKLHLLQNRFSCAILITNQVMDNIVTSVTEPSLGLAWSNNVVSRFSLNRSRNKLRNFEVIFGPDLIPTSTEFIIETEGLLNEKLH